MSRIHINSRHSGGGAKQEWSNIWPQSVKGNRYQSCVAWIHAMTAHEMKLEDIEKKCHSERFILLRNARKTNTSLLYPIVACDTCSCDSSYHEPDEEGVRHSQWKLASLSRLHLCCERGDPDMNPNHSLARLLAPTAVKQQLIL